ncbi:YwqJ-related putative deaminase [Streptomyces sp. NPDC058548]|uniref:YwqJ-related putative deaminase n=1 Tax=Streptomyces sp. NPDC058548 TaxID=3346545 RepID=UPI00365ACC66
MKNHRRDALDVSHLSEDEQRRLLVDEADKLAHDAKNQPQSNPYPEGKHRLKTACAGTLLHDGTLTSHSSSTNTGDSTMSTHPALKQILDRVENDIDAEGEYLGSGHGKCAEVSLISDRLHQLDPNGTSIVSQEDIRKAMDGSRVYSVQIGDMRPGADQLLHGDYKPPCRSCERMLPLVGVIAHH